MSATGTIGNGLAAGLTGSGLADKGGRVTGGFDSGRFGDTPAAEKGGRVTGAQTGGKTTAASPDPGRFGGSVTAEKGGRVASVTGSVSRQPTASVGRQSSINGQYDNGGINAGQIAQSPRVGNGLAVGLSAPSVSAREVESRSMGALAASRAPAAGAARRAEDASMSALDAARTLMAERGGRVVAGAAPVGNGLAAGIDSARFGDSVMAERGGRVVGTPMAEKGGRVAPSTTMASITPPSVSARAAETQSMERHGAWQGALSSIRSAEAQKTVNPATGKVDAYNSLVGARKGATTPTHADLTSMSIREVMDLQSGMQARGHRSTAVGAYQTLRGTLGEAVQRTGLDLDQKFTAAVQDFIAQDLAENRARQATRNGEVNTDRFTDKLSKEWAGLGTTKSTARVSQTLATAMGLTQPGAVAQAGPTRTVEATAYAPMTVQRDVPSAAEQPKTAREAVTDLAKRGPGLMGISPSFNRFDTAGLSKSVISVAEAVRTAVPGATVISGYRSPERNAAVGGAKKSQHMQGNAVDIDMRGWSDERRAAALSAAVKAGATGIGIYNGGTSLHVDTRPGTKSMWGGNPAGQFKGMSLQQAPAWSRDILSSWQSGKISQATPAQGPMPTARPDPSEVSRVGANSIFADTGPDPVPDAAARSTSRTTSETPRAPASERFGEKYLGASPATASSAPPTPTARPAEVASKTTPARSAIDKVVAGVIDVGVGLLPGIGPAAAIYGAAAPFLGLPTVGDLALNLRDTNDFDLKTALRTPESDTGDTREMADAGERLAGSVGVQGGETPTAAPVPAATFAEKYLAFSDPTPRPTPSQKWGGSGANSVPYAL